MLISMVSHEKTEMAIIFFVFCYHVIGILHSDWLSGLLLQKVEAIVFQ